jgi:hypothetical protein
MSTVAIKTKSETLAARVERAAMMVYLEGATEVQISKTFKISCVTVRDWKRRSEWDDAIGKLREHQHKLVLDRLALMTARAASAVEECLGSDNDGVKLKAATWVLERSESFHVESSCSSDVGGDIERFLKLVTANEHPPK